MFSKIRPHLSYANVTVTVLLFLVVGGGSAAALQGRNSVFSNDISNGQVKRADVGPQAVGSAEIAADGVRGRDVAEDSLSGLGTGVLGGTWENITGAPSQQRPPTGVSTEDSGFGYLAPVDFVARDLRVETNGVEIPEGENVEVNLLLDGGGDTPLTCSLDGPNDYECDSGDATALVRAGEVYSFRIRASSPALETRTLQFGWRAVTP